ncbi:hypothetical protein [Streptosporangium sp. NPDC000239]|uniref:Secreted protein n=1 Tax=Streptosporangium jomthongense TaxID=1193683 RepID=A0ABV8F369_9ACTN
MNRTIRSLLGVAAATAVLAVGVPALTSSASAATTGTATAGALDVDFWGSYYSKYRNGSRAKANGQVWDDGSEVHVQGRLYDKNSPWRLCGYVQVKFENADGDESYDWARQCVSSGYRSFHFSEEDVDNVQVRVCYWERPGAQRVSCGRWNYIYEADDDE